MTSSKPVRAIIWDYDGTLIDTYQKNLNVTRKILEEITGSNVQKIDALQTLDKYKQAIRKYLNWRDLYLEEYGLSEQLMERAGHLWAKFQLLDETPAPLFHGIDRVLKSLDGVPQGIVSMNAKANITQALKYWNLLDYFKIVVGYEEVGSARQKPEPDGLLLCIEEMTDHQSGIVFYIGDHAVDAQCAFEANLVLNQNGGDLRVVCIGAFYGSEHDDSDWAFKPDHAAKTAEDILKIIENYK